MARLWMMKTSIKLSPSIFFSKVYLNILKVCLIAIILPISLSFKASDSITFFILSSIIVIIYTTLIILFVGCNKDERIFIFSKIHNILIRKKM